jgi:uncharacterized protein YjdB
MPASIVVGGAGAKSVFTELDSAGNVVATTDTINYVSSDQGVATVDASGNVSAIGAGAATIAGTDATNNLTGSDVITVTAAVSVPTSATLVLTAN